MMLAAVTEADNPDFWHSVSPLLSEKCFALKGDEFVYVGSFFAEMFGVDKQELFGQRYDQYLVVDNSRTLAEAVTTAEPVACELKSLQQQVPSTKSITINFLPCRIFGVDLVVAYLVQPQPINHSTTDTDNPRLQLATIMENFSNTIFRTNMDSEIELISDNVELLMGYSAQEVIGTSLSDYYWTPEDRERSVEEILKNNGKVTQVDTVMRHKEGYPVWLSSNVRLIKNARGEPVGIEGIGHDVTYQKKLEQKLETLALTDSLTQLPNRRALMDELHAQFIAARATNSALSIICIDVNDMKGINETYGYMYGDALLKQVATLLRVHIQHPQTLGRISGDEYLLILPGYTVNNAVQFITPVLEAMQQQRLSVGDRKVSYSLAIGISELKKIDLNEYALLDRGDKASLVARMGKAKYEIM